MTNKDASPEFGSVDHNGRGHRIRCCFLLERRLVLVGCIRFSQSRRQTIQCVGINADRYRNPRCDANVLFCARATHRASQYSLPQ